MAEELQVIETATGECIKTIDVTGKSETHINKTFAGLTRNMNINKYHVQHVTIDKDMK